MDFHFFSSQIVQHVNESGLTGEKSLLDFPLVV